MSLSQALVWKIQLVDDINEGGPGLIGGRIYPGEVLLDDKTFPLVAYQVSDVTSTPTYSGVNKLRSAQIALTIVSPSYIPADTVAEEIVDEFDGASGTWGPWDTTGATTTVQGCFLAEDGVQDDKITDPVTEAILYYIKVVTFQVWYVNN